MIAVIAPPTPPAPTSRMRIGLPFARVRVTLGDELPSLHTSRNTAEPLCRWHLTAITVA